MSKLTILAAAAVLAASGPIPAATQDWAARPGYVHRGAFPRTFGTFDGRDDTRDFPTNGFFPGNFAANPADAAFGVAGIFGSNPEHAYPSQIVVGSSREQMPCMQGHSYYRAFGKNDIRRRC